MRVETLVYHAGEGYVPDTVKVEPYREGVVGYGYNDGGIEAEADVVVIEAGTVEGMHVTWLEYAVGCSHIRGADDDHYDYFPSNFDGLVHLGQQIDVLNGNERCMVVCRFIWDALAFQRWDVGNETLEAAKADFDSEIVGKP